MMVYLESTRKFIRLIASVLRQGGLVLLLLLTPAISPAASLVLDGDRASLKAEGELLRELLHLFEQRGVSVAVDPSIKQQPISGNWENIEVSRLIAQLAGPHSYALEWQETASPLGTLTQVTSIRIFPRGKIVTPEPPARASKIFDVVENSDGLKYIRGEIVVGMDGEASIDDLKLLLNKLQGSVVEVINPPGLYRIKFNADLSVEGAMAIASSIRGVKVVEPNLAFTAITSSFLPSAEVKREAGFQLTPGETAIGVFDTGLDPAYVQSPYILGAYDAIDPAAEITDANGHGTVASLVAAGVITPAGADKPESGVPVLAVRVFDDNGMTSSGTIMRAFNYAAESGVKIISMSWGSEVNSQFLETTMNLAAQNGMTLYAAAGNDPTGAPVYPAGYDAVIGVGGLNPDGSRWEDSNYGDFVEHYEPAFVNFENRGYAGTSIASPYAAFKAARDASQ